MSSKSSARLDAPWRGLCVVLACLLLGTAATSLGARAADKPGIEPAGAAKAQGGAEACARGDACFDLHLMILGDWRLAGRDRSRWKWGGGAKLFLGNLVGKSSVGGMVGFRALALRESGFEVERWVNQESLMAYDVAASAETRFCSYGIIGGHLGAAFVPASKVSFRPNSTITRATSTGQVETTSNQVPCTADRLCQLNRGYGFALSVGARIGFRAPIGERRELTLQLGMDWRAPVRAQVDLDGLLLLGFASY